MGFLSMADGGDGGGDGGGEVSLEVINAAQRRPTERRGPS